MQRIAVQLCAVVLVVVACAGRDRLPHSDPSLTTPFGVAAWPMPQQAIAQHSPSAINGTIAPAASNNSSTTTTTTTKALSQATPLSQQQVQVQSNKADLSAPDEPAQPIPLATIAQVALPGSPAVPVGKATVQRSPIPAFKSDIELSHEETPEDVPSNDKPTPPTVGGIRKRATSISKQDAPTTKPTGRSPSQNADQPEPPPLPAAVAAHAKHSATQVAEKEAYTPDATESAEVVDEAATAEGTGEAVEPEQETAIEPEANELDSNEPVVEQQPDPYEEPRVSKRDTAKLVVASMLPSQLQPVVVPDMMITTAESMNKSTEQLRNEAILKQALPYAMAAGTGFLAGQAAMMAGGAVTGGLGALAAGALYGGTSALVFNRTYGAMNRFMRKISTPDSVTLSHYDHDDPDEVAANQGDYLTDAEVAHAEEETERKRPLKDTLKGLAPIVVGGAMGGAFGGVVGELIGDAVKQAVDKSGVRGGSSRAGAATAFMLRHAGKVTGTMAGTGAGIMASRMTAEPTRQLIDTVDNLHERPQHWYQKSDDESVKESPDQPAPSTPSPSSTATSKITQLFDRFKPDKQDDSSTGIPLSR